MIAGCGMYDRGMHWPGLCLYDKALLWKKACDAMGSSSKLSVKP